MKKIATSVLMAICLVVTEASENDTGGLIDWSSWLGTKPGAGLQSAGDHEEQFDTNNSLVDEEGFELEPRIVGGSAATVGQFPWQVAILKDGASFCGGSIISSRWVLTAGHCVVNATAFVLIFGSLYPYGDPSGCVVQMTKSYVLHEQYYFGQDMSKPSKPRIILKNDIGLIKLSYPLCAWTNSIAPLKLPTREQQSMLFVGENVTTAGWGFNTYPPSGVAKFLQFANLRVITNAKCDSDFVGVIAVPPTAICTGGKAGKSTYNGDSGGALAWKDSNGTYRQVGIVSFGNGVGNPLDYPSGFARVTSYLDWISNITGIAIDP